MRIRSTFRRRQSAFRILALCVALASTALLSGCGSFFHAISSTTTTGGGTGYDIVYAGKNNSNSFVGYYMSSTTAGLTKVTGSPFSLTSPALAMAISPLNSFLYVGTANGIFGYSIAAGGALTALNSGTALASGLTPVSMDVSPDGDYLAVLPSNASYLYIYALNTNTGLFATTGTQAAFPTAGGTPQCVKFSPLEATQTTSVLAASFGAGGIETYVFSGGVATPVQNIPTAGGVSGTINYNKLVWNTAGTVLFVASGGTDYSLISYPINATLGTYNTGTYYAYPVGTNSNSDPTALTFNNTQSYIYVANTGNLTVPGYSIPGYGVSLSGTTPTYTQISGSPFATPGYEVAALAFDNLDTYILAFTQTGSPDLVQYTIDTGSVAPGRLEYAAGVSTGLSASTSTIGGITMVTTH
jgi:hypothetical protein